MDRELLKQLTDKDGALVLFQDLIVERLAEDAAIGEMFLNKLPNLDVWTFKQSCTLTVFCTEKVVRVKGAVRYAELLKAGK